MVKRLRSFTRALFRRTRFEDNMADEMRFHMEAYAADLVRAGHSPADAARRAKLEFGGAESLKEDCRQSLGLRFVDQLQQDLRYALRQMRRSPGFTIAAVVSLALGIGANTAIFSLMDAVLLRDLPVPDPGRLVYLAHANGARISNSANFPLFERYERAGVLEGIAAYSGETFTVRAADALEQVDGQYVTGRYHAVVGVPLVAGRGFTDEKDRGAGAPVAVISDAFWARRFGRSQAAIGSTLTVNSRPVTIVGVTAAGFNGMISGYRADLTLPMSFRSLDEPEYMDDRTGWVSLALVGRLRPGETVAQARTAVDVVFKRYWLEAENAWVRESPEAANERAELRPARRGSSDLRGKYREPLRILMGMVIVVLFIACANVANLLLARTAARTRELAVRMGIGAGRWRLVRQFLTESLFLSGLGGLLGLVVAYASIRAVLAILNSGQWPVVVDASLNMQVLAFTIGATVLTGLGFGLAPAIRATRVSLAPGLKSSVPVHHGRARSPLGKTLLVGQIALCVVVVAGAALLGRSLFNLRTSNAGFSTKNLLLFKLDTRDPSFTAARRTLFYPQLLEHLRTQPGIVSATLADRSPVDFSSQTRRIEVPGVAKIPGGVSAVAITPSYFDAFRIKLIRGRGFTPADRMGAEAVAIANETMVRAYFGDADPLGRTIVIGGRRDLMKIVGVVSDARHESLRTAAPRTVYTPLEQPGEAFDGSNGPPDDVAVILQTASDPRQLIASAPALVREVNPDAVVSYVRTMDQQVDGAMVTERLLARLSAGFALLALLLAVVGLYGVTAYDVTRRTREIAIRMALGATKSVVLVRVLREAATVSIVGVGIGLAITAVAVKAIAAILFGLSPTDPWTLGTVAAVLIGTAMLAGLVPARRAAATDPVRSLSVE